MGTGQEEAEDDVISVETNELRVLCVVVVQIVVRQQCQQDAVKDFQVLPNTAYSLAIRLSSSWDSVFVMLNSVRVEAASPLHTTINFQGNRLFVGTSESSGMQKFGGEVRAMSIYKAECFLPRPCD